MVPKVSGNDIEEDVLEMGALWNDSEAVNSESTLTKNTSLCPLIKFALVLILITTVAIISEVQFSVITKNVNIPGKKTKKGFKLKIIKMIIDGMCIKIKIKRNKCFDWQEKKNWWHKTSEKLLH
jgi:hypothetical protein